MNDVGTIRPEFLQSRLWYGREIELQLANGERHKGRFVIVELDEILASHNERTFSTSEGYPLTDLGENINDRDYTNDPNAQAMVLSWAQNFEPSRVITTSRTDSGTPIISEDGFVVSGNNRTMSLKLAADRYPERYEAYKEFLKEEIMAFGFDEAQASAMIDDEYFARPVLVRIDYDFPEYTTLELSKYNKETKKAERPVDKAIKLSKLLLGNERCYTIISDTIGQYDSFTDFYKAIPAGKKMINDLVNCDILTTQELPAYWDNGWTRTGKGFIEDMMAAMILKKSALMVAEQAGVRRFKQIIGTSLPVLLKNNQLEDSLIDDINQAVLLQSRITKSGMDFEDYITQSEMFDEKFDREAMYLNRLLAAGRNTFKGAIEGYNGSMGQAGVGDIFGETATPKEAFEHWIVKPVEQYSVLIERVAETSGAYLGEKKKAEARAKALILIMKMKAA